MKGSLGQIRLGLPKGSAEGSAKVVPKSHQGSTLLLTELSGGNHLKNIPDAVGDILWAYFVSEGIESPKWQYEGQPSKTRPKFQSKEGSFGVLGIYIGVARTL